MQLDSALVTLAANSEVPAQFQQLARVERSKLASAGIGQVTVPLLQHQDTGADKQRDSKVRPADQVFTKSAAIGDVVQIKLQLD
jgi:hypothetical protein